MALQGAFSIGAGYQKFGSPNTTLQETWGKLQLIKEHLEAVSDERRQKIEAAAAAEDARCRSLTDIEDSFRE